MISREAIYSALFALASNSSGFTTSSRRLRHWNDVQTEEMPALFLAQRREVAQTSTGQPTLWRLEADLYIYVSTRGELPPGPILNEKLDAIEAALAPDNPIQNVQTLGGLVHRCLIGGAIETDEGTLGDLAVAIVPIVIEAS